jgi:hypothetical protein
MSRDNGNRGEGSVYLQQGNCCHLIVTKENIGGQYKRGKKYFQYDAVKFATFSV